MNITTKNGFRAFLIFTVLISFGSLVDVFFPSLLSPELQDYFEKAEVTSNGIFLAIYSLVMTVMGIVALIGVLMYRKWGRALTVTLTILGILLLPIFDEQISSGLSAAFSSFSATAGGIILALMYLSPVKEHFERQT